LSKQTDAFGKLAEALENAATAARELEAAGSAATTTAADEVVPDAGTKKKSGAKPAAEKPAKPAKAKTPAITFEILKAKLTELVNTKGKEAAKEILSEFGAPKLVDLSEDDYSDAHAKAVAALADDEEPAGEEEDMFGD
jgi:hypothetical protein